MLNSWVLVVAVLGGACALPAPLTYTQALAQAVDSYNQRPEVQNVFRLLSADPEPTPDIQLSSLQRLNFTVMETRCPARSGVRLDTCDRMVQPMLLGSIQPCLTSCSSCARSKTLLPDLLRKKTGAPSLLRLFFHFFSAQSSPSS
uniref:Uncharacterized protein n=1 Tax=Athene cunicularia TaxID=194338 RepID=A0A663M5N8_ATHCN